MVDVEALLGAAKRQGGHGCETCVWLQSRPPEERKKWEKYIKETGSFNHAQVARAMATANEMIDKEGGVTVKAPGSSSISNHRSGHIRNLPQ